MLTADPVLFIFFAFAAGLLIGCVGIGGVILVPLLTYVSGVEIHRHIRVCSEEIDSLGSDGMDVVGGYAGGLRWGARREYSVRLDPRVVYRAPRRRLRA